MGSERKSCQKIIVILGPTASGKSEMAVNLALWLNEKKRCEVKGAEIISADSRQVYKGMDVGTGKITKEEMQGIPHHLLDVASPKRKFTVAHFKSLGEKAIKKILEKDKIPIVCGGSAFYIKALVDGMIMPEIPPDWNLRESMEKKSNEELYKELLSLDPERARSIDKNNKRRLIRALEIIKKTGKPVPKTENNSPYKKLFLGIRVDQEELNKKIEKRLHKRIEQGMIEEVQELQRSGVSWNRLEELGLEYRWVGRYLQGKISYEKMVQSLLWDIIQFSKRQKVWWKHDERISWIKNEKKAKKIISDFLFPTEQAYL